VSEWSEWLVYRLEGAPLGPLSTKTLAEAILAGTLPQDVWVAAPGGTKWLRAIDVPVIAALLQGLPTRRPRESGMRMVTAPLPRAPLPKAAPPPKAALPPKIDDTIRMRDGIPVEDDPIVSSNSPITVRSTEPRGPDGFPIPPPSSTPTPPSGYQAGETIESPGTPRKRSQGG
jgi:hypothetical protein